MQERTNVAAPGYLPNRETLFALCVTAVFLILAGFTTCHHEMWRDEMGPWLIGRDSHSLFELFHNIRYDGHPSLWYLMVWPLTSLTRNPEAMQWLNLAIAAGAAFLIAKAAPVPRWLRIAAALGYFPVYEYGTIARNYAVGLLALVAFCAVFPRRREHPMLLGALLLVAANTNILACILAIAALFMLMVERFTEVSGAEEGGCDTLGLCVAAVGIAFAIYQVIPPADSGYAMGWHFGFEPAKAVTVLKNMTTAYLPLPRLGPVFWETELFASLPLYRSLSWLLAPALLLLTSLALMRRPLALCYYLTGSLGLLAFFYVKHVGYLRHHGFLFVCCATALWLGARMQPVRLPARLEAVALGSERAASVVFVALVAVHLASALVASRGEYRYIFSAAKATADLIRSRGLQDLPLIADLDIDGMPVVGYLDKPRAFYTCGDRYGSFVVWDTARMLHTVVWEQAPVLARKAGSKVVVVVDDFVMKKFPLPASLQGMTELVGCRKAEIATEESYCVYLLDPNRTARP